MNNIKLSPLSARITKAPKDFISRFLDITIEDMDKYSEEQIGQMVESTVEQMSVEILKQFQIELNGGKREF